MKFRLYLLKRIVEDIFMFPLIMVGRAISFFSPLEKDYAIFFFFPFYYQLGSQAPNFLKINLAQNIPQSVVIVFEKKAQSASCFY